MIRWMRPAVLAGLMALASPAFAFIATNDLRVVPQGEGTFDIPFRGLTGASDFWCAAGDFALRGLNASNNTRIYRVSEPPRRAGQGVRFSLSPDGAASSTGLASFGRSSASLSAGHAVFLCDDTLMTRR